MVTHHVSLRRDRPALVGELTPSPGECDLSLHPTQAQRASSKMRSYFYPSSVVRLVHANGIELERRTVSYRSFSRMREKAAICEGAYGAVGPPNFHDLAETE
jgi:hypothetical protein